MSARKRQKLGNASDAKAESKREQLTLTIQPAPPAFPFVDHAFELTTYLMGSEGNLRTGLEVPLLVTAVLEGQDAATEGLFEMEGEPAINKQGLCKARLRFKGTSMEHNNAKFSLRVGPEPGFLAAKSAPLVASASTAPFTVVRQRLEMDSLVLEDGVWYKDEGGREKCIETTVRLVGATGAVCTGMRVPLRLSLVYESGDAVADQTKLKVAGEAAREIDPGNGSTTLRVRIEDVSRNHQGQRFRLQVAPDTQSQPMLHEISAIASDAIDARSKRNRRNRKAKAGAGRGGAARGAGPAPRMPDL